MRDRQPVYPGRVRMLPVAGQENVFDMVMADEPTELGTPPIKKNLLTDLTASLYGLPDPTVNDLLGVLSGAAMVKRMGTPTPLSSIPAGAVLRAGVRDCFLVQQNYINTGNTLILLKDNTGVETAWSLDTASQYSGSLVDTKCIEFADSLPDSIKNSLLSVNIPSFGTTISRKAWALSQTELGNSAVSSAYVEGTALNPSVVSAIIANGKYYWSRSQASTNSTHAVYYAPVGSGSSFVKTLVALMYIRPAFCLPSTFIAYEYGGIYYLSDAPVAAADILGNIIGGFTRIETGEYTGTGTFGASAPTKLTFPFEPKLVLIDATATVTSVGIFIYGIPLARTYMTTSSYFYATVEWAGNTLLLYNTSNGTYQYNASGTKYKYVAIG